MNGSALFVAVFLACLVEAVEALTIVLAAGTTRGWRSTTVGVVTGFVALAVVTVVLGPAVSAIPIWALRLFVGGLLLVFGLQWLRKAILRASGLKDLHDEVAEYEATTSEARTVGISRRGLVSDWYAFTLTFKAVTLEGLEVAFIVVTFGANQESIPLAAAAAVAAIVAVALAGAVLRKPLARVPENSVKFVVGVLLTAFGLFWCVEGAGGRWPGDDLALLALVPGVALYAMLLVALYRRRAAVTRDVVEEAA